MGYAITVPIDIAPTRVAAEAARDAAQAADTKLAPGVLPATSAVGATGAAAGVDALVQRLTAARALLLDEITAARMARLDTPVTSRAAAADYTAARAAFLDAPIATSRSYRQKESAAPGVFTYPDDAINIVVAAGAGGYGGYVEAVAATGAAVYLLGLSACNTSAVTDHFLFRVGKGVAGAEIAIARVGCTLQASATSLGESIYLPFHDRIPVATATRLAVDARGNNNGQARVYLHAILQSNIEAF